MVDWDNEELDTTINVLYREQKAKGRKGLMQMEVECLNHLGGADTENVQVLKSAAGFYIGTLFDNGNGYFPYARLSQEYWGTRKEAEQMMTTNDYERTIMADYE